MYHVELRQFPHNFCRFNLTEEELSEAVVGPWAREQWVELGERKWSPHQAKLTVLEGPRIPVEQISMGRGWRHAVREGHEVTARVLAAVRESGELQSGVASPRDAQLVSGSLGLELLSLLAGEQAPLARAWRLAAERFPERSASDCLAIAERAVRSLISSRLIALLGAQGADGDRQPVGSGEQEVEEILLAIDSWTGEGSSARVWMRRV